MAKSKKAEHAEFLDSMSRIKPSAEVKFRKKEADGHITEQSSSRKYWEGMTSDAVQDVAEEYEGPTYTENPDKNKHPGFRDVLNRMENGSKIAETLRESIDPGVTDTTDGTDSPLSRPANDWANPVEVPMRTIDLMIRSIEKLVERVDKMEKNPVIHVPAPVINITLPEVTRTVTKVIERGPDGYIKEIKETVEETPNGEPTFEIKDK